MPLAIVELGSNSCVLLAKEGGLELDYNVIKADGVPRELVQPIWTGDIFYATVIGMTTVYVTHDQREALTIVILLLIVPVGWLFLLSFTGEQGVFSLAHYQRLLHPVCRTSRRTPTGVRPARPAWCCGGSVSITLLVIAHLFGEQKQARR